LFLHAVQTQPPELVDFADFADFGETPDRDSESAALRPFDTLERPTLEQRLRSKLKYRL
jgi:hypothetical protein